MGLPIQYGEDEGIIVNLRGEKNMTMTSPRSEIQRASINVIRVLTREDQNHAGGGGDSKVIAQRSDP